MGHIHTLRYMGHIHTLRARKEGITHPEGLERKE